MNWILGLPLVLLIIPVHLCAQQPGTPIQAEMSRLDVLTADPDLKLVIVAAMAETLQIHRNHLLLLRKETGQSFSQIFVSELRSRAMDDESVLQSLRALLRSVNRQLKRDVVPAGSVRRPVLLVSSAVDHNSAGTLYSLVPTIGFDSSHVAAALSVPYYRISNAGNSAGAIGDVYATAFLRGRTGGYDFGSTLTLGAPTGNRSRGLGAGKVTADATGTVSRQFEFAKPWVSAGFANSIFNNVGYQRPYTTDGKAAHFSGGLDFTLPHKLTAGVNGFGLEPVGDQIVYSQTVASGSSGNAGAIGSNGGGGMMPGGGMGSGTSNGGSVTMPPLSSMPFYERAQQSVIGASELRDYGASLWLLIPVHSGFSLNVAVARSIPLHLTTVQVGVGIDVARLFFPGKHF